MNSPTLPSWRPGPARDAVTNFLSDAESLPVAQRIAVFDNDGTLWCERPSYIQLDFMVATLQAAAAAEPALADRPEYAALLSGDKAAIGEIGLPRLALALGELWAGREPEEFTRAAHDFVMSGAHSTLGVGYRHVLYQPMLELIDELRQRDFTVFLVTGGGTEFVRAVSRDLYDVPPDRVVGTLIRYEVVRRDGAPVLIRTAELDGDPNEGAAKVENIQRHLGQRPVLAAGNSPGDAEMIEFATAGDGPRLGLVVDHDDADREFAYTSEAGTFEAARPFTETVREAGWTAVSMKDDWSTVFASPPA